MKLTDWRGNEYGVGDTVLYPRAAGYAVEMVEATVLDIKDANPNRRGVKHHVRVQPLRSSRTHFGSEDHTYSWAYGEKPVTITVGVKSITKV